MLPLTVTRIQLSGSEIHPEPAGDLLAAVSDHIRGGPAEGMVVLGEFGSGKTLLCETLARTLDVPCTVVPLRVVARSGGPVDGLARVVGASRLQEAQDGRRVLLLDGLDEVPLALGALPGFFDDLVSRSGPRWVLTSRPGHFRTEPAVDDDQVDSLTRPDTTTLVIDPIARSLVQQTLEGLPGGRALLDSVDGLEQLSSSPMLLHAVHAALPYIEAGRPIQPWGVFDAWIRHDLSTGPDHDAVIDALVDMAWTIFEDSGHSVELCSFSPELVRKAQLPASIRSALLVSDLDGQMRFGHRSVYEFLLAAWIAPRLAQNQGEGPDALSGIRITEATRAFLVGRVPRMPVRTERGRVFVPRGNFIAGGDRSPDERPLRIAHLARGFWMSREPVTHRDWARYLEARPDDRTDAWYLRHWGTERTLPEGTEPLPVYHLWPEDADAYAAWKGARLPTADEWEKAVRGTDGRRWPWGDHFQAGLAVTGELGVPRPLPVRAFGCPGVSGLYSAIGGVFEYTASDYQNRKNRGRTVMGGCFTHPASTSRASLRLSHKLSGNLKAGLRLAWDD